MRRFSTVFVFALLGILGLFGCGGSTVDEFQGENLDSGVYSAAYNRAGGKITVTLAKNSSVTVTVVDDSSGTFVGTGKVRSNESFSVVCSGSNDRTVTIDGTLSKSALGKNYVGKARGSITFTYDAPLVLGSVSASLFAGTYSGTVDMKNFDQYPCTVAIDSDGFVVVNFTVNGTAVQMRGLVFSDGRLNLSPAEEQTLKFWAKGSAYMFADLQNLYINCSVSNAKDGKQVGTLRAFTPYLPG